MVVIILAQLHVEQIAQVVVRQVVKEVALADAIQIVEIIAVKTVVVAA